MTIISNSSSDFRNLYRRYFEKLFFFKKSFTLEKFFNLFISRFEVRRAKLKLKAYPQVARIEILNICNLRCPHCALGSGLSKRPKRMMSFADFKIIIDKLSTYLIMVDLAPNGEPFLHPDIFRMINYLNEKKICSAFSSNFNIMNDEKIENILKSQPTLLNLSIDGTSHQNYVQYRRGGDFNRVIDNVRKLLEGRKEAGQRCPLVVWQYIPMKQNENEIEIAKKTAKEIGVDFLSFDIQFLPLPEYWFFNIETKELKNSIKKFSPTKKEFLTNNERIFIYGCRLPWTEIDILVDGTIVPCCRLVEKGVKMGNIFNDNLRDVWNNKFYQSLRENLKKQGSKTKCSSCLAALKRV